MLIHVIKIQITGNHSEENVVLKEETLNNDIFLHVHHRITKLSKLRL